jgi:hypothetical protein
MKIAGVTISKLTLPVCKLAFQLTMHQHFYFKKSAKEYNVDAST